MKASNTHRDAPPRWHRALPLLGLAATAWQGLAVARALRQGHELVERARRFENHPPHADAAVLVLGDSTGLGVGSESVHDSLTGLLAGAFPHVEIVNACASGARVDDVRHQLRAHIRPGRRFKLALVMAGGNDVLQLTPPSTLAAQAAALLHELRHQARHVVWLGCADVGTAPALKPPLRWLMSWKCRRTMNLLQGSAQRAGVQFIDFCTGTHSRTFASQPDHYFAADGIHPSPASYRHCFEELMRRAALAPLLGQGA